MDRLVWPTAKAHLYLLEAAHVKNAVGREVIRRNKDALRELRCLQEILAELHAGELGGALERKDALEAAASRWQALNKAAAALSLQPEEVCDIPPSVKRYLRTRPHVTFGEAARNRCCSETGGATSTRAPSTAAELDAQSSATETRSEAATVTEALLGARPIGHRMERNQLDQLAADLKEQLDQEHTSLMSSIEEVQALMEAEVAGVSSLPPRGDLEAFVAAADAALAVKHPVEACREEERPPKQSKGRHASDRDAGAADAPPLDATYESAAAGGLATRSSALGCPSDCGLDAASEGRGICRRDAGAVESGSLIEETAPSPAAGAKALMSSDALRCLQAAPFFALPPWALSDPRKLPQRQLRSRPRESLSDCDGDDVRSQRQTICDGESSAARFSGRPPMQRLASSPSIAAMAPCNQPKEACSAGAEVRSNWACGGGNTSGVLTLTRSASCPPAFFHACAAASGAAASQQGDPNFISDMPGVVMDGLSDCGSATCASFSERGLTRCGIASSASPSGMHEACRVAAPEHLVPMPLEGAWDPPARDDTAAASPRSVEAVEQHRVVAGLLAERRPRWADIMEDDCDTAASGRMDWPRSQQPTPAEVGATAAARVNCYRCRRSLGKASFSRRAWRRARELDDARDCSDAVGAVCLECCDGDRPLLGAPRGCRVKAGLGSTPIRRKAS